MTALQNWLSNSPFDPRGIKAIIFRAWRGLTAEQSEPVEQPQLMGRGLERC